MPEGCAWHIARGVARLQKYTVATAFPSQLVAHTTHDSVLRGQMLREQLSPLNGIAGRLNSNILPSSFFFGFISRCRVFIWLRGGGGGGWDGTRLDSPPRPDRVEGASRQLCFGLFEMFLSWWCDTARAEQTALWRLTHGDTVQASWQRRPCCSSSRLPRHLEISLHVWKLAHKWLFPRHSWPDDESACDSWWVIFILEGRSFDSAPQEEHVGRLCAPRRWIVFDSLPDWGPDAGTWVVTPRARLHNACLLHLLS